MQAYLVQPAAGLNVTNVSAVYQHYHNSDKNFGNSFEKETEDDYDDENNYYNSLFDNEASYQNLQQNLADSFCTLKID